MKRYLKLPYLLGFVAIVWLLVIVALLFKVRDLAWQRIDLGWLLGASFALTSLLIAFVPLGFAVFYAGRITASGPLILLFALGNHLHRIGSKHASRVTYLPIDLSWPVVRDWLFHGRVPDISKPHNPDAYSNRVP
jgi:hypothetical protein